MKKLFLIFTLILALLVTSCGNTGTAKSTQATSTPDYDMGLEDFSDTFNYSSFSDIAEKAEIQQQKGVPTLTNYLPEEKLTFDGIDLQKVYVTLNNDRDGNRTGGQLIDVYWHEENCSYCATDNCTILNHAVKSTICYLSEGEVHISEGYERKSETKLNYVKTVDFDYISHFYVINDNCYVRFSIKNYLENYDEVVAKADAYADYLRGAISTSSGTVTE